MTPPGADGPASVFALLGGSVEGSLSPAAHNAAFLAAGRHAMYLAISVTREHVCALVEALTAAGGGGNVTIPHKQAVLPALDHRTESVEATGACNTFWVEDGAVWGDNTDVEGFLRAWENVIPTPVEGSSVLVLGAGGAARAVVWALLRGGAADVAVYNRSLERASALLVDFPDPRVRLWNGGEEARILVNATPMGKTGPEGVGDPAAGRVATNPQMAGTEIPPSVLALVDRAEGVLDLTYGPAETEFVARARALGLPASDGRNMLVAQAEAAYTRWFREAPPQGVMARALTRPGP